MEINKENFKTTTENMRRVLVHMANRQNPFEFEFNSNIAQELGLEEYYTNCLIRNLVNGRLLSVEKENSITPRLTHIGLELGQDLGNDERFLNAIELCEKQEVFSLSGVAMAVRQLAAKAISEEIKKQ